MGDDLRDQSRLIEGGLLTPMEAAALLGVGKSSIYKLMASGHLVYSKILGVRRIPRLAVIEYAAGQMISPRKLL